MLTLLIFSFFALVSLTLAVQAVLQFTFRRSIVIDQRIGRFIGEPVIEKKEKRSWRTKTHRTDEKLSSWKQKLDEQMSKEAKSELKKRLEAAGLDEKWTPADFRLIQFLVGSVLATYGAFIGIQGESNLLMIVLISGVLFLLGTSFMKFYVSTRIRKRTEQIEKEMADFFDMVNLSLEAGLGLDAAFVKACDQVKGPLSVEFGKALEEMRLGKSRREALVNLRNRVTVDEFRGVLTSIIQADQLGIGMSKAVRALTHRIREHQRQRAREKGMKAPIKMLFPMVLFIFPAIFIVILGPFMVRLLTEGLF
ncbi:type II secretion system F family protein [Halobacillus fulvus]|nr:type II secretion system F family protein [Halobacillus fulvus]